MNTLLLQFAKILAGVAVPALLATFVPRRWLLATLAAWFLLPLFVILALLPHTLSGLTGFGRIASQLFFLVVFAEGPWCAISGIGIAIGLALRRRRRPRPVPQTTPPPQPLSTPRSAPEWQARHIGFGHDGLILDGLDVWGSQWRRTGADSIELPHPAYPAQRHFFDIYEAGEGVQTREFAVGELSNGVWGFYTRHHPDEPRSGTSTDGTLGFENRYPVPPTAHPMPTGRLWRIATGEVLADGAGWTASQVIPEAEASLLYALRYTDNDALFRLYPRNGNFDIVGENRPQAPLDQLAETAAAALRASMERAKNGLGVRLAPDGTIRVEIASVEWSNTHWVDSPRVREVATGRILLDLWNTDWDAAVSFPGAGRVNLDLRRYNGAGRFQAGIDLATGQFTLSEGSDSPPTSGPIAELSSVLEAASQPRPSLHPPVHP